MPAEQERDPEREGRELFPQGWRVWNHNWRLEGRDARGPRPQAENGRRADRIASREVPTKQRGPRHGGGPLRWAEDDRSKGHWNSAARKQAVPCIGNRLLTRTVQIAPKQLRVRDAVQFKRL